MCIGCFVGYPTAILAILLIGMFNLSQFISVQLYLTLGFIFLSTFILSLLNLTKIKLIKVLQKFLIGLGAAFIFWGILTINNARAINVLFAFTVLTLLLVILNIYHTYGFYRTCVNCKTPFDWNNCTGLRSIKNNLEKYSLKNVLAPFDEISRNFREKKAKKVRNN